MAEEELINLGFKKTKIFHMECFTLDGFSVWYNTCQCNGFFCEYPLNQTHYDLDIEKVKEIYEAVRESRLR